MISVKEVDADYLEMLRKDFLADLQSAISEGLRRPSLILGNNNQKHTITENVINAVKDKFPKEKVQIVTKFDGVYIQFLFPYKMLIVMMMVLKDPRTSKETINLELIRLSLT